ncbi:glycosyltransferase family 39 protein [bacterium]|nr:glycosyltransferase family 39 protein [bacterium]
MTTTAIDNRRPFWPWTCLIALVALGAALRLAALGQESLWSDEYFTIRTAGVPTLREVLHLVLTIEPHPPLYFFLMHGWIALFGSSDAMLRLPSALAGIAALPLMFLAMRWLIPGRPSAALVATFLLAISPMHVYYSQEARSYSMQIFFELMAIAALAWGLGPSKRTSQRWMPLAALGVLMAFLFQYYSAFIWATVLLILWLARHQVRRRTLTASAFIMILGGALPLAGALLRAHGHWGEDTPFLPKSYGPDLLYHVSRAQLIGPWYSPFATEPSIWSWIDMVVIAAGLALALIAAAELWPDRRGKSRGAVLIIGLGLACMLAVPVAVSFVKPIVFWGSRYLIIAVPVVVALLAVGATGPRRRIGIALLVIVAAAQLFYLHNYYAYRQKQAWDTVAHFIDRTAEPGATVWVLRGWNAPLLQRYLTTNHPLQGANSVAEVAARPGAGPQYVVSNANLSDAFIACKIPIAFTQIIATHRPGQELWVMKIYPSAATK